MAEQAEPQTLSSEMFLLKGGLLLARSDGEDVAEAEAVLQGALARADQVGAPMLQLRAALALAQLWSAQGKAEPAHAVLSEAYGRMTEGFTTLDLTDARALLDALS
jgi:predicted ATPase